jgi:hypothetical protein
VINLSIFSEGRARKEKDYSGKAFSVINIRKHTNKVTNSIELSTT